MSPFCPRSSSALALSQDPAPNCNGNMRPVVPDLLKDCPNSIVQGVRAQHESLVRVHQKQPQLPQEGPLSGGQTHPRPPGSRVSFSLLPLRP